MFYQLEKNNSTASVVVFLLKVVSLKQNKSHSISLDLHLLVINYANEGLPEYTSSSDWLLWSKIQLTDVSSNLIGCLH